MVEGAGRPVLGRLHSRRYITLLCSTVPGYIDSDGSNFFVKENLPRVTPSSELLDYLSEAIEVGLKALPSARRISN